MARKQRLEEHVNHERWLVSYADFITLLFAFFVVMYSISSVNEDKYRVLSDSMVTAFSDPRSPAKTVPVGNLVGTSSPLVGQMLGAVDRPSVILATLKENPGKQAEKETPPEPKDQNFSAEVLDLAEAEVNTIADDVEHSMESLIDDGIIDVKRNKFWLEVEIKSSLLFPSGSSALIPESVPLLTKLSDSFVGLPNRLHIEGFTDNEPINTAVFPSNWELSSARAAAVVRLFERNGVEPARLASIGYSEFHPISDNDTEEGRAKNRRVVIVVMASLEGQQSDRIYEFELLKEKSLLQGVN
ncbi:MAG: flagellar motor protein MotD [Pseudomonadales bacterium]|nr:flagellar motor protein MotD [Halioglobus sp.]MCP5120949.1 flagellar motor protein MotD [Pseudomonadales bacterium]MCP5194391.1 flagellar motor protein MotD [Pseudomonadales bacterium]